jgi:hypothetical protein
MIYFRFFFFYSNSHTYIIVIIIFYFDNVYKAFDENQIHKQSYAKRKRHLFSHSNEFESTK